MIIRTISPHGRHLWIDCDIYHPAPALPIQESGLVVDERQVAQVITMLANNYNTAKGQGDDGDLSSALTSSLFSSGEGQVRQRTEGLTD